MTIKTPSGRKEYQQFDAFYTSDIIPFLAANETGRQSAINRFAMAIAITVLLAVIVFFFFPWSGARFHASFAVGIIGASIGYGFVNKARASITGGLLERICSFFGFQYRLSLSRPAYEEIFRTLDLLPNYNREEWEDEVRGRRGGADFVFCEAHLKYKSSGKNSSTRTVFHGQLLVIDYHKKFLGETVIKRDAGVFNRLMKPGKGFQQVGIASPKFEKIFEAWSTDQVEARALLDPIVLERFEELDRLFGGAKIRAAFSSGKLFLALETGDKINMGSMFTPLEGAERVENILKEFDLVFDLIDVLMKQLDHRIDGAINVEDVRRSTP